MTTAPPPLAPMLEGAPPHDEAAEQAVLGALLIDPERFDDVRALLSAADFHRKRHALIFEAMERLSQTTGGCTYTSLVDELERTNHLDLIGGAAYVTGLINATPTAVYAEAYAGQVARAGRARRLIEAGQTIAALGYDRPTDIDAALGAAEAALATVIGPEGNTEARSLSDVLTDYLTEIEHAHANKGEVFGLATGYRDLDTLLGGLRGSQLYIVAGRPGVGKSLLMAGLATHVARHGTPVALFSLEMQAGEIAARLVAAEASVDGARIRSGYVDEYEWRRIGDAFGTLAEVPLYIDDLASLTPTQLATRVRRLVRRRGVGLIVVDYLQLMHVPGSGSERQREVAAVSRELKRLAKALDIPVVAGSQLNRAVETRSDHRPVLSDLRESGGIEADADVVILLNREDLYKPDTDRQGIVDLIVAKHRGGPTGTVPLKFFASQSKLADLDSERTPPWGTR